MNAKSEQTLVGLFVLLTVAIVIVVTFVARGEFGNTGKTYHAYFPFAGGLETGATVRYLGGPKIGRVDSVRARPEDPSHVEVTFTVEPNALVKTDSKVKIMSVSPLGENHLEILAGSAQAGAAPSGSKLDSEDYLDFNALMKQINTLAPDAQMLIHTLNDRAVELKVTLNRVNDLLNDQNRANLSGTLSEAHGMIAENRPLVRSTLEHVNGATEKLGPLIDNFQKTADQARKTLEQADAMIGENRPDIRKTLRQVNDLLVSLQQVTGQLNQTLDVNSENIDEVLDNMVRVTENLREFTDRIKTHPNSLIRTSSPPEHKPGE